MFATSVKRPRFVYTCLLASLCFKKLKLNEFFPLLLILSLPNVAKGKFRQNLQISFSKILTNKKHLVKVQAESFHLNGHIIGFRPQTQKLESPYKTPLNTLAVKGLIFACKHGF